MIIGLEGKHSLEGFLDLTIYVYTLLSLTYKPHFTLERLLGDESLQIIIG